MNRNGSILFDGTDFHHLDETFEGLPFFRKHIGSIEYMIYQILLQNPHPNIVSVYRLTKTFVDMEMLTPVNELEEYEEVSFLNAAHAAKDHLQKLGIFYIDWKSDNLGITSTGTFRLFDFDGSGIFHEGWVVEPMPYWSYRQAVEKGLTGPTEIDDFAFDLNLTDNK